MKQSRLKRILRVVASQTGFDLRVFWRVLLRLPQYVLDWRLFRKDYRGVMNLAPCLLDRFEAGGSTRSEYFWQDLIVARWIYASNPVRHVDVGSRIDGFVAHVASFRNIEVIDIRPVNADIPGVVFRAADMMQVGMGSNYCDSLSCLHALEHFGLGRYGDQINPLGYQLGLSNMVALLKPGGIFYLAVPIGRERVEFNAHRVFDPTALIALTRNLNLVCKQLTVVTQSSVVDHGPASSERLQALSCAEYNLGIFIFAKGIEASGGSHV